MFGLVYPWSVIMFNYELLCSMILIVWKCLKINNEKIYNITKSYWSMYWSIFFYIYKPFFFNNLNRENCYHLPKILFYLQVKLALVVYSYMQQIWIWELHEILVHQSKIQMYAITIWQWILLLLLWMGF